MKMKKRVLTTILPVLICFGIFGKIYGQTWDNEYRQESIIELSEPADAADGEAQASQEIGQETIHIENIPEYAGEAYVIINDNIPEFEESEKQITDAFELFSELDSLGRCGQAYANICPELEPREERGAIGQIKPSGWHTVKYSDIIDGNYLYNRCHLIGYQLSGENANEKNLMTGTRYLNVVGMLPFENQVDDYVDSTGNHVLYRVTPVFEGNNLVASGVQMEAWSVEDEGRGVCFNVYCYNVQPGIEIDYATGDSWESTQNNTSIAVSEYNEGLKQEQSNSGESNAEEDFVINTNTRKFHLPTCSGVSDMAEYNKYIYTGTIQEVMEQGYSPCRICLPEL